MSAVVPPPHGPVTLLDACAVVNLYATRSMGPIVAAVDGPVAVVNVVAREAQFVFRGGTGDDAREREPIDLQPIMENGLLQVLSAEDEEELLTFIDLSQDIGQGEAMTAALAIHRGCVVVTDDHKPSTILRDRGVHLRTSLELIHVWSRSSHLPREMLRVVLTDVRQRGRYDPPRAHSLRAWWDEVMRSP